MAVKIKEKQDISEAIKSHLNRNQSWLSMQTGISEPELSRKLRKRKPWTQEDLDKINKVLNTNFKL